MRTQTRFVAGVAALLLALPLAACGARQDDDSGAVGIGGSEDELVVGGIFTLSGSSSTLGEMEQEALEFAIHQFNEGNCIVETVPAQPCEGGGLQVGDKKIPVKLASLDDAEDSRKSIDAVNRLISRNDARIIWGPRLNDAVTASAGILEPKGIISMCAVCSAPAMTIGRNYGFNFTDTGPIEKHALGNLVEESADVLQAHGIDPKMFEGRTKTALIGRDEAYTQLGAKGWAESMEKAGLEFDEKADKILFPGGTTDFAPFVAKLAQRKPQIVMLDSYVQPDMIAILKLMIQTPGLDFTKGEVVLLGNDVLTSPLFTNAATEEGIDLGSGYVYAFQQANPGAASSDAEVADPEAVQRYEEYIKTYTEYVKGDEIKVGQAGRMSPMYDAMMWLLAGVEKAGTINDNNKIADAIKELEMNGTQSSGLRMFTRPDNGEKTGQIQLPEYIMTFGPDNAAEYTGLKYEGEAIYYGDYVYGDEPLKQ